MTAPRFLRAEVATMAARPEMLSRIVERVDPTSRIRLPIDVVRPGAGTPPAPTPPAPAPPAPAPPTLPAPPLAALPGGTPFDGLPMPSPGDRIRAEDFRRMTQCLQLVQQATVLAASLFGRTLGEARAALAVQGWALDRVVSVFGQDVADGGAHEERRVVQVVPAALGLNRVHVVVTEAVASQRLAPSLLGLTHAEAMERLRAAVGEVTMPDAPMSAPALGGLTLGDAARAVAAPAR